MTAWSEQHTLPLSFLGFYGTMLAFQVSAAMDVVSVHAEFRRGDDQSRGYGVLIAYLFAEMPSAEQLRMALRGGGCQLILPAGANWLLAQGDVPGALRGTGAGQQFPGTGPRGRTRMPVKTARRCFQKTRCERGTSQA